MSLLVVAGLSFWGGLVLCEVLSFLVFRVSVMYGMIADFRGPLILGWCCDVCLYGLGVVWWTVDALRLVFVCYVCKLLSFAVCLGFRS